MLQPQPRLYTVDEFYELIEDGQKADLIDGVIHVASPDTLLADQLNGFLYFLVGGFAEGRDLGKVTLSRFAYRLGERNAPEPDLGFVAQSRVDSVLTEREGLGPPDLVVEVVARDSKSRDYGRKKKLYEETGVREYWIVDSLVKRAQFWRLGQPGYEAMTVDEVGIFRSDVLPGFWMDVNWLFQKPMPNRLDCLRRILSR